MCFRLTFSPVLCPTDLWQVLVHLLVSTRLDTLCLVGIRIVCPKWLAKGHNVQELGCKRSERLVPKIAKVHSLVTDSSHSVPVSLTLSHRLNVSDTDSIRDSDKYSAVGSDYLICYLFHERKPVTVWQFGHDHCCLEMWRCRWAHGCFCAGQRCIEHCIIEGFGELVIYFMTIEWNLEASVCSEMLRCPYSIVNWYPGM